jgi:hypothetical protein
MTEGFPVSRCRAAFGRAFVALGGVFLLLSLCMPSAWAGQFLVAPKYSTNGKACVLVSADFNGDGNLDVAGPCPASNTIIVLRGNGDGTFQPPVEYPTVDSPFTAIVTDFNQDGRPDLAVLTYGVGEVGGIVAVHLGNGDGTFQPRTDYLVGFNPFFFAAGDLNGDGAPEIVVSNSNQLSVSVLLNKGDGTFIRQNDLYTGQVGPLAVADVNGDGKGDLLAGNINQNIPAMLSVFLGNGGGAFQPPLAYPLGSWPNEVIVADVNGDGKLDVVSLADPVSILLGNGDGTFRPRLDSPSSGAPTVLGDFNGDGVTDLATGGWNSVNIQFGNGNATFQPPLNYGAGLGPTFVETAFAVGLVAGDFNHDQKDDLVVTNSGDKDISVLLNSGDGTFPTYRFFAGGREPSSVAIGDFNGDGKPDLAVANGNPFNGVTPDHTVSVLLGTGNGTFQSHTDYPTGKYPISVAVGDFNGDGRQDIVTANHDPDTVSVLLANANGTFRSRVDYFTAPHPWSVAVADFNGDGKMDLAVATAVNSVVSILLGNGDGTFRTHLDYNAGNSPLFVTTGDFNGDGKLDLATANAGNNTISVLLGNGDGTFGTHADFPAGGPPVSLAVRDFNGDGKNDLAVADGGLICRGPTCLPGTTLAVLLNNGAGTFQPAVIYPAGAAAQSIAVGDFNHDGKPDLAVANSGVISNPGGVSVYGRDTVSVLWGKGDGSFRPHLEYVTAGGPFSVAVGDLNGDHRDDVVTADVNSSGVTVLLDTFSGPAFVLATSSAPPFTGTISSTPAGINCGQGGTCNAAFDSGVTVNVTAAPPLDFGSLFQSWSGDCTGSGPCVVDMTADRSVTATFVPNTTTYTITVIKTGTGSGTVQGPLGGVDCGSTCSGPAPAESSGVLTAFPDPVSIFAGWSGGGCAAGQIDCVVTMHSDETVTAIFNSSPVVTLSVQFKGAGSGSVTVYPSGHYPPTTCTTPCSVPFAPGAAIQVGATPNADNTFGGWGGACSVDPCYLTMNSDQTVIATFNAIPEITALSPISGDVGTPVTISGKNFGATQDTSTVAFNGTAATPTAWRATSIVVPAPPGATNGNVVVTVAGIASNGIVFTFTPGITALSTNSAPAGTPVTITGTNFGSTQGTSMVTFNGKTATVTSWTSTSIVVNVPAGGTGNVVVTINGIASNGIAFTVQDFSVPATLTDITVTAGQSQSQTFTITPGGAFDGVITFACSNLPSKSSCAFTPSSVTPGGGTADIAMMVSTTAATTSGTGPAVLGTWLPFGSLGLVLAMGVGTRMRRRKALAGLALFLLLPLLLAITSCGGGGSSTHTTPGTPPGTYNLTMRAASGPTSHSSTFKLTVK